MKDPHVRMKICFSLLINKVEDLKPPRCNSKPIRSSTHKKMLHEKQLDILLVIAISYTEHDQWELGGTARLNSRMKPSLNISPSIALFLVRLKHLAVFGD